VSLSYSNEFITLLASLDTDSWRLKFYTHLWLVFDWLRVKTSA